MWSSSQVLRLANCLWLRLFLNISTFFSLGDKLFLSDSFQNKLLDSFLYILNLGYFRYFFYFSFRYHLYYKHLHITLQFSGEHPTYQTCLVRVWMLPSHLTLFLSFFLFFSFLFFFFFFQCRCLITKKLIEHTHANRVLMDSFLYPLAAPVHVWSVTFSSSIKKRISECSQTGEL